jgi:energy-coupling factor transport system ATP-binding protein
MVRVRDLHWRYPSFGGQADDPWTLKGIDLKIERGEFFGIAGPSGAGKTTTCRAIVGLIPHGLKIPFQQYNYHLRGQVWIDGELITGVDTGANVVAGQPRGALLGKGIAASTAGIVLQDPENQFLKMSLLHEVAFGLQLMKLPCDAIEERVNKALEMVGLGHLVAEAAYIHPNDLSDGQKQRVAIASFLALRPRVLILDEPTSDLDPVGKREVIEIVQVLRDRHDMTVILVEQDPEVLHRFCDRIALLDRGRVRRVEGASGFYRHLDLLRETGIHRFEVSEIASRAGIAPPGKVPISLDEYLDCLPEDLEPGDQPADRAPSGQVVVQVQDLEYAYPDGTQALRGVSFDLRQGEVLALLGPNGSGKTTVAKVLNGLYKPAAGSVSVLGQDVTRRSVRRMLPSRVGYVFQNPDHQIFTRRVADEVAYGVKNLDLTPAETEARIDGALETVGLTGLADEDPLFLGKGQRQRLAVAAILAMEPEVIIVDEPTTGQDYRMVQGIMDLLRELHHQGRTVMIITHDMTLVADYCQRVVVLQEGRNIFCGSPRALFSQSDVLAATQLRAPQAISLSLAMREGNEGFPLLLNTAEWVAALEAYHQDRHSRSAQRGDLQHGG